MLHLYRRHLKSCPHTTRASKRCHCPIHVQGTLAVKNGLQAVRVSLDTNIWEVAQKTITDWALKGEITQVSSEAPTLAVAVEKYLADCNDRRLAPATYKKYSTLLRGRLVPWCRHEQYQWPSSLTLDCLTTFRSTWPDAPLAKSKNQERLRAFLAWCEARGWITSNPAKRLSSIRVDQCPTLPFSIEDMTQILGACDRYPQHNSYGYDNRARMRAFVLVLRWSGLRISDVVNLTWDRLVDGRRLRLYTQKTGTLVAVPLPDEVLTALAAIKTDSPYVFRSGRSGLKSTVSNWQRALRLLFRLANISGGHAHRFRDTFAVELLLKGVDLIDVSVLLGHASVKVTERHYSAWVATRQRRLEEAVARTWITETPPVPAPDGRLAPPESCTEETVLDPVPLVARPDGVPARRPIAESASLDPASGFLARTGTDAECTPPTRPTLRLVVSERGGVQGQPALSPDQEVL